jgi:predicted nucleotidyltransferase
MSTVAEPLVHGLPARVVARLCDVVGRWPGVEAVWLYGSRAKGTHRPNSDIDLCLQAPRLGVTDLLHIEEAVDDLLLPWKVDLSLWHQLEAPDIRSHIQRVGVDFCESGADGSAHPGLSSAERGGEGQE